MHADALDGITVVALTTNIPGPLAAARLRSMGARVVKIEPPQGDALKLASPTWYKQINADFEIVVLDLKEASARVTLDQYVSRADILLTAMRARSVAKAGLDWKTLHNKYPRVSHISISGEAPPNDDRAGHDLTYQARAGTIVPPHVPRTLLGDMAAAERAVSAALAAYIRMRRTAQGSHVNVSITDAAKEFGAPFAHGLTSNIGPLGGALPGYNIYRAREGYVAVAALEPHFEDRLRALLHIDSLDSDEMREVFMERDATEWEKLAESSDIPLAAVR